MSFENVKTVEIKDYVANLTLQNSREIQGIQIRKTNDNGTVRFNLNMNSDNMFFSIDVNQVDLSDLTEVLLYLKDNLNVLY